MSQDPKTLVDTGTNVGGEPPAALPCLTILYHPDLRRVGEQSPIPGLNEGRRVHISRLEPAFAHPGGRPRPLEDPYISRKPVEISRAGERIVIAPPREVPLVVDAADAIAPVAVPESALAEGITLQLGRRVALLLHQIDLDDRPPRFGLIGDSDALWSVRRDIARAAAGDVPVLIQGETGVGKELVARSIHDASARAGGPWLTVNMATLVPSTALSELFGHERNAFTGAERRHLGLFEQAEGGTLFLDEVGDTPPDVQGMLLRTLETNTIRRMGDSAPERKVDVRILAATDAPLDGNTFRNQLFYRLAVLMIRVPPLRARRDDIPRLTVHFLREDLARCGQLDRLEASVTARKPWFPLGLMMRLFGCPWRGNVRELRNAVYTIVAEGHDVEAISSRVLDERMPDLARSIHRRADTTPLELATPPSQPPDGPGGVSEDAPGAESSPTVQGPGGADAGSAGSARSRVGRANPISDDELEQVMIECRYSVSVAAARLNLPRSTMYGRIDSHPRLRKAKDLPRDEVARCYRECRGDLDCMVDRLRVSKRGIVLKLRDYQIIEEEP